jgi:hypothetical protein
MHVLIRLEARRQSTVEEGVEVEEQAAELLPVHHTLRLSLLIKGFDKAWEFLPRAQGFLFIFVLVAVPSM